MVFVSNFHCAFFFLSNWIFTNVYIIYINKLHNGKHWLYYIFHPFQSAQFSFSFSRSVIYILNTFLIVAILLWSKFYFPPCYDALNTQIHSLLVMFFLRDDHIFFSPKFRPFEKKVKKERQMMTDYPMTDKINIGECRVHLWARRHQKETDSVPILK